MDRLSSWVWSRIGIGLEVLNVGNIRNCFVGGYKSEREGKDRYSWEWGKF